MSTPLAEPRAGAWLWAHLPMFDPLLPPRGVSNPLSALPGPAGEHVVVLRTLKVPFDVGMGLFCRADVPHPTTFNLFPSILINALFTAGASPILVSPHSDAGALGSSACAKTNSKGLVAISVPEEP